MIGTYNATGKDGTPTYGGYSQAIVVDENYVLRIPDSIPLDKAAPLLCAGITLYSPLHHWGAGPGKKVAIVGLGGLGHMGVKIAHAMGAEVTVLSQSLKKMEDGLRLGADDYYATSDPDTFTKLAGKFDLIVNTVSANLDLGAYLGLLATDGTLVEVGAPEKPMEVPFFPLGARAAQPGRFDDRRHPGDPGDARLLRRARRDARDRGHRGRLRQRGLRARAGQRRAVPLRHRHRHAVGPRHTTNQAGPEWVPAWFAFSASRLAGCGGGVVDPGQRPTRRGQLRRHPVHVLTARVVTGDVGDERLDLVGADRSVGKGG